MEDVSFIELDQFFAARECVECLESFECIECIGGGDGGDRGNGGNVGEGDVCEGKGKGEGDGCDKGSSRQKKNAAIPPKILEILALDCFNEAKCKQVAATIIKPKIQKNYFQNSRESKPPRFKFISAQEKCIREITSNLNKINGSNMDVIATRILKMMDGNNVADITVNVLNKACTNGTYLQHFVSLIDKLQNVFHNVTLKCIQEFSSSFISSIGDTFKELEQFDYNDYDQFCTFLKLKNTMLNKNKLVLIYMSRNMIDCNIDLYFPKIVSFLDGTRPIHLQDTMVQMIADMPVAHIDYNTIALLYHESFLSTKSKFMIQDILGSIESSNKNIFVCKAKKNTIKQKR